MLRGCADPGLVLVLLGWWVLGAGLMLQGLLLRVGRGLPEWW